MSETHHKFPVKESNCFSLVGEEGVEMRNSEGFMSPLLKLKVLKHNTCVWTFIWI